MKRRLAMRIGIVLLCAFLIAFYILHRSAANYTYATVTRGEITQEALASGNVESSTTAALRFMHAGTLTALPAAVGTHVEKGDLLAALDATALEASYREAHAALERSQANFDKALAGSQAEDVGVTAAAKNSAAVALGAKESELRNVIGSILTGVANTLGTGVDQLFSNPTTHPSYGIQFHSGNTTYNIDAPADERRVMSELRKRVSADRSALMASIIAHDDTGIENERARKLLDDLTMLLEHMGENINAYAATDANGQSVYQTYQSAVATARATTETERQSLLAAQNAYQSAQAALTQADSELVLKTAPSRQEDVRVAQADVASAQAGLLSAASALSDARIVAPYAGVVTDTQGTIGAVTDQAAAIVTLMPDTPLDINVNVSENRIVDVSPGQPVRIELDALPRGEDLHGTVSEIYPAETVIGGAIYYRTKVRIDTADDRIRSGMTANVWIKTGYASSTLLVPASAIGGSADNATVRVADGRDAKEVPVKLGLVGGDGMIEVLEGLSEGQRVITGE